MFANKCIYAVVNKTACTAHYISRLSCCRCLLFANQFRRMPVCVIPTSTHICGDISGGTWPTYFQWLGLKLIHWKRNHGVFVIIFRVIALGIWWILTNIWCMEATLLKYILNCSLKCSAVDTGFCITIFH